MMKNSKIVWSLFALIALCSNLKSQTTFIEGKVTDGENGEELIGAIVQVLKEDVLITSCGTDFNGNYKLTLEPGIYDIRVSYIGFPDHEIKEVLIKANQHTWVHIPITGSNIMFDSAFSCCICVPIIDKGQTTSGQITTDDRIKRNPSKNIKEIAAMSAGVSWQ